ncbi:hypothetical protein [Phenylobacterium sp.]|uniref:hypothetical protein n=1 Tax=Phenylobacterium sp. TaxID=1871053 RepID=UPI002E3320FD|nr:hypothetical protein [Phenylobacterium sp.]HEX3366852.1 hypothetical protein [Phenylobacterium sp.]
MADILAAIQLSDKQQSRARLLDLWERLWPGGAPLQLCSMAHHLADTATDIAGELEWDLRALEAATGSREPEDRKPSLDIPESGLPSLYLSVAEGYRRLGDLERARRHVACAERRIDALPDDAYGTLVRGGLRRLQGLLAPA